MATHEIKFGDLTLTDYIETYNDGSNSRLNLQLIPKRHGGLLTEVPVYEPRRVTMSGKVMSSDGTKETLRTTLHAIGVGLGTTRKQLRLFDDRYFYAYKTNFSFAYIAGSGMLAASISIEFVCPDPFEYYDAGASNFSTILNSSDTVIDITNNVYRESFTLTNNGNVYTFLTINVTATLGACSSVIIRNITTARTETYDGTIASGQNLEIDNGNFTVENNGVNDLTNWVGTFLWLDPGANSFQIEGNPASYAFSWTERNI